MRRSTLGTLCALGVLGMVGVSCGGGSAADNLASGVSGGAAGASSTGSSGTPGTGGSNSGDPDASVGNAGGAANAGGSAGAGMGGSAGGGALTDAPQVSDVTCANATAFESFGIMVAQSSGGDAATGDAGACGTKMNPCTSIQAGIYAASMAGKQYVYIATGTYSEDNITLAKGVTLAGGWSTTDWTRGCPIDAGATTIRNVTGNTVIAAVDLGGAAGLDSLTLKSKLQSAVATTGTGDGESLYGVSARGATTSLTIANVKIQLVNAGRGGNGAAPGNPAAAPAAGSCTGTTADGQDGAAGTNGAGGVAGKFLADGYTPAAGATAGDGTIGGKGAITRVPDTSTCGKCTNRCGAAATDCTGVGNTYPSTTAAAATPGCGGNGGGGGGGGRGGGSSIALFVSAAKVGVTASSLIAGDGGGGGNGTSGHAGGDPSNSVNPAGIDCFSGCGAQYNGIIIVTAVSSQAGVSISDDGAGGEGGSSGLAAQDSLGEAIIAPVGAGGTIIFDPCLNANYSCYGVNKYNTLAGGTANSGSRGGLGGTGGGGSGGTSFAIAKVGGGTVTYGADTTVAHGAKGAPGTGTNVGADGISGDVYE